MTPALIIALAWLLFGGSHLLMSASSLRNTLKLSPAAFTVLFSFVTVLTMSALIAAVILYGDKGAPGPDLGQTTSLRWTLLTLAFAGGVLATAGLINYPKSHIAELSRRLRSQARTGKPLRPPNAVERISRHPFFAGVFILMLAHTLLAETQASAVYFGGFVILTGIGIPLQDRKLRARWQQVYRDFEDSSSVLSVIPTPRPKNWPSGASPWMVWLIAIVITVIVLGLGHPAWAWGNGAGFAIFILLFGLFGTLAALKARRVAG